MKFSSKTPVEKMKTVLAVKFSLNIEIYQYWMFSDFFGFFGLFGLTQSTKADFFDEGLSQVEFFLLRLFERIFPRILGEKLIFNFKEIQY